jgi:glycosyltransferase involved in cell wall biosynthesis
VRVLFLTDRLSELGGADHHLRHVIGWAADEGWDPRVACGRVTSQAGLNGVPVHVIRALGSTAADPRLEGLSDLLEGADVVHVQNVMNPLALAAATATGRAVVTVQDHRVFCPGPGRTLPSGERCREAMGDTPCARCLPDRAYRRRLLRLTADRLEALAGARLVVLSDFMAEELRAVGLASTVIPPWVAAGPPRDAPGDALLLGGRLVRHKAPLGAWEAWRRAGRPLPLRVAGAGAAADRMAGATLLGWLDQEALEGELRGARALLFPARWQEPFGILGVQALAQATPVVVSDVAGTRAWSDRGCIRVPPGDEEGFARAIRDLCDDPVAAQALGEEGRGMVAGRFNRFELTTRLRAVYRRAAAPATPPRADAGGEALKTRP